MMGDNGVGTTTRNSNQGDRSRVRDTMRRVGNLCPYDSLEELDGLLIAIRDRMRSSASSYELNLALREAANSLRTY